MSKDTFFIRPMKMHRVGDDFDFSQFENGEWAISIKMNGWYTQIARTDDGEFVAYTGGGARMPGIEAAMGDLAILNGTLVCGELLVSDTSVCHCEGQAHGEGFGVTSHFRKNHPEACYLAAFDLLQYKGRDLTGVPFGQRLNALKRLVGVTGDGRLAIVEYKEQAGPMLIAEWLRKISEAGAEGAVFGKLSEKYESGRRVRHLLKWRQTRSYDTVICGLAPKTATMPDGWKRLQYGWADRKVIGTILGDDAAGPEAEMKKHLGKIAELHAQGMNPQGALLYPRLICWRTDKVASDCDKSEGEFVVTVK